MTIEAVRAIVCGLVGGFYCLLVGLFFLIAPDWPCSEAPGWLRYCGAVFFLLGGGLFGSSIIIYKIEAAENGDAP